MEYAGRFCHAPWLLNPLADTDCAAQSINLKGVYATAHHFIKTQPNPKEPVGTFITTNSGLAGLVIPGLSAYSISKLAGQRLVEFLDTG